jgi:hypothetical protein
LALGKADTLGIVCGVFLPLIALWAESPTETNPVAPQFRAAAVSPRPSQSKTTTEGPIASRSAVIRLSQCPDSDLKILADFIRENHSTTVETGVNDRETLARLLPSLGESVQILEPAEVREEQESPFHADLPEERVGYLRLGSMTPDHVSALETALAGMLERKIPAFILDLRASGPVADPECLAQLCRLFCTKGKVLFRLRKPRLQEESLFTSRQEPLFRGPLAILVGPETQGVAEAAAFILRREAQAVIVGSKLPGTRAAYTETTLPTGITVRVAVGTFEPPGASTENTADLPASISAAETRAILAAGLQHPAAEWIREPERPRLNEAALVAGLNPELDSGRHPTPNHRASSPVDIALQAAVDFCTALRAFDSPEPAQKSARQKSR